VCLFKITDMFLKKSIFKILDFKNEFFRNKIQYKRGFTNRLLFFIHSIPRSINPTSGQIRSDRNPYDEITDGSEGRIIITTHLNQY